MSNPFVYKQTIHKQVIQPLWNVVQEIRNEVRRKMENRGAELRDATQMVASELVENAVKYGLIFDYESDMGIEFLFEVNDREIMIEVTNSADSEYDLANVTRHIDAINKAKDPQQLYVQRLTELMDNPGQGGSQLGLYRIAYEGEFSLSYEVADKVITVKAYRKIKP
jgi:hypothetical protein